MPAGQPALSARRQSNVILPWLVRLACNGIQIQDVGEVEACSGVEELHLLHSLTAEFYASINGAGHAWLDSRRERAHEPSSHEINERLSADAQIDAQ